MAFGEVLLVRDGEAEVEDAFVRRGVADLDLGEGLSCGMEVAEVRDSENDRMFGNGIDGIKDGILARPGLSAGRWGRVPDWREWRRTAEGRTGTRGAGSKRVKVL